MAVYGRCPTVCGQLRGCKLRTECLPYRLGKGGVFELGMSSWEFFQLFMLTVLSVTNVETYICLHRFMLSWPVVGRLDSHGKTMVY